MRVSEPVLFSSMASEEFHALQHAMAQRPVPPPPASIVEHRQRIDDAMAQMPLAEGAEAIEHDVDGVFVIECRRIDHAADAPVIVYAHGGGFRIASALAYRSYGSHLARATGARVMLVDYRLAPEHVFPAALDDCVAVHRWVLASGVPASRIVVMGDSAGGGLAASLVLHTLAEGPTPAAAICCSPWVDLTVCAATYDSRAEADRLFSRTQAEEAAPAYLGTTMPDHPLVSPIFGDWRGAPPMLIQVGDAEVLLDDAHRLHEVALASDVDATLHVYPEMPHIWQMSYPAFPEAVAAVEEVAEFIRTTLATTDSE